MPGDMDWTVDSLMVDRVLVVRADDSVGHMRQLMDTHQIHALPVIDNDSRAVGIVTSSDLVAAGDDNLRAADVMTGRVHCVERGTDVRVAARLMRHRRVHHLLVTEGPELVGILSAFDALQVVERLEPGAEPAG